MLTGRAGLYMTLEDLGCSSDGESLVCSVLASLSSLPTHSKMHRSLLLTLLTTAIAALARPPSRHPHSPSAAAAPGTIKCPIIFDGRIKTTTQLTDFDSYSTSPFNPDYVKGQTLKWSDIIKFPSVSPSRFDDPDQHKPIEVTISDASIFMNQRGFRRAGLQFQGDSNTGSAGSKGVKTIHFSVRWDNARPLNLSHEYLNVWHETADYSANQFNFEGGTILGQTQLPADTWKVLDRNNRQIWAVKIEREGWQNFAITVDYEKK